MSSLQFAHSALRWLYVDFNSYFASVEQQLNPKLRGKPIAVVPVMTDSTCAIAASYEAKAFGIKTGTPIYEAKKLCPDIVCVPARHEHYVEYHHRAIEEIERHIPVSAVCSIDEMACMLMDNENSVEAAKRIAHSIKEGLAKHVGEYVRCSIGIAQNRYLAKIATDLQKPDGLTILQPEDLPGRLLSLKLRDLPGVGRNMEKRLYDSGIFDMETLWKLRASDMRRVWHNVWGERMWYMLRGWDFADEAHDRSTVGHSHVLAPDLRPQPQARYVARRLTTKAASRLRRLGYYARRFHFSARLEQGSRWHAEAQCFRAQDNITFLSLLEELWRQMYKDTRGARLRKVSITLYDLVPAEIAEQPGLFDVLAAPELRRQRRAQKLSFAMDKLNHRYGRDTISLGMMPDQGRGFSGTKIAFTRIPDMEEFLE